MKRRFLAGLTVMFTTLAQPVLGQGVDDTHVINADRTGWHIGADFQYQFPVLDLDKLNDALVFDGVKAENGSGAPGLRIRGGYRAHPYIDVNADFAYAFNLGIDAKDQFFGFGVDDVVEADVLTFLVGAKLFPFAGLVRQNAFWERFSPFLGLSIGLINADIDIPGVGNEDDTQFAYRAGGGFDVYINRNWFVSAEAAFLGFPELDFGGAPIGQGIVPIFFGAGYRF